MKAIITLEEHQLPHIQYEDNNIRREGYVYHDTLLRFLKESTFKPAVKETKPIVITPVFPTNTVKFVIKSEETSILFMVSPEQSYDITYHNSVFEQVPYPNLVFAFIVHKDHLIRSFVASYKDKFLREETTLYRFPYSNVWENDGRLCLYDRSPVPDLVSLQTFPYRWATTPNNDHLYLVGESNNTGKALREIFEKSQHQKFDYDILNPFSREYTFESWSTYISNQP